MKRVSPLSCLRAAQKKMNAVARRGQSFLLRSATTASSSSAASSTTSSASSRVLSSLYSSSSSASSSSSRRRRRLYDECEQREQKFSGSSSSRSSCTTTTDDLASFKFGLSRRGSSINSNRRKWISTAPSAVRLFSSEEGSEAVKEEKPAAVDDDTVVVDLSTGENVTPPSSKILKLADEIVKLNMLEINDLGKILQEKMGISDQQLYGMGSGSMVMGGGGGGGGNVAAAAGDAGGGDAPAAEAAAQTEFSLKLDAFDASSKIKVIKEVRAATELGLKEAKELVEGAPCVLKKGLSKADAEAMMAKIVAAGATCSLE
jgi:large subunit ribosomal protein L7/L12